MAPSGTAISVFLQELTSTANAIQQQQQQQQQQEQQATQASSSATSSNHSHHNQEQNRCYICFGTDEDSVGRWVKPCQCTLISHEDCLLDWIDKNRQQFAKKQVYNQWIVYFAKYKKKCLKRAYLGETYN
jgi:hypothetical protein